jgi:hypothetical protein
VSISAAASALLGEADAISAGAGDEDAWALDTAAAATGEEFDELEK